MAGFAKAHEGFAAAGLMLWAIGVDPPRTAALLKADRFLPFPLLCDLDRRVTKAYGVHNPREHGGIPIPAVYGLRDGVVVFAAVDTMARQTRPAGVLQAMEGGARAAADRRWVLPGPREVLHILRRVWRARGR